MACDLCLLRTPDSPFRLAGLDVCDVCFSGSLGDAWAAWGLSAETRHDTVWEGKGDNRHLVQRSEVRIQHPTRSPVVATFTRQWDPPRLLRWLGLGPAADPEVGDPLFDDFVRVNAAPEHVLALLADEGTQSAIMSVVGAELGGRCELDGTSVRVSLRNDSHGAVTQGEIDALATALAVRVERYARGLR